MAEWWGTRSRVSPRLRLEVEAMRAAFSSTFRLTVPKGSGLLFWTGDIEVNLSTLRSRDHTLKVVYPKDYPNRPAEAYVLRPRLYSEKHQYEDGQLCLFNPKDGATYGWNPSRSTAVTVTSWAIQWLYAYYTWRHTGDWPGIEERITRNDEHRGR
jgi:hypothetical protein